MTERLLTLEEKNKELIEQLFREANLKEGCPHIRRDSISPYCSKGLEEPRLPGVSRRSVCDTASLQLWCLDPKRYQKCIWYNNENFDKD